MTPLDARYWLEKIHRLPAPKSPFNLLNVCGGHERSITQAGLRSALPNWLKLIPGPGCPVCVCPESDIALAISIALNEDVTLAAFGDMLRVPINNASKTNLLPKSIRSMELAKAAGADIRAIASPMEVRKLALANPERTIVFFAAGFETTMAPVAALVYERYRGSLPKNIQFLISGRRTWPAVARLLGDERSAPINAMIAPGHVATIMGADEWQFVVDDYQLPTAIAGFQSESLLHAFYCVLKHALQGNPQLVNCYPEAVTAKGNSVAQTILHKIFDINSANWRGIGMIDNSGYQLQPELDTINADKTFSSYRDKLHTLITQDAMPKSCQCADVVMARTRPNQCPLYGTSCTPRQPVGPCMVSDEGACKIWWSART
ncbi:hydrogenase formation protein HypD [Teredinibacter haidensis]|uniref:hydrogenase formation protein HypD n=1 Tax=Teredinibacter haidensis TaxID=2731755 RepID=UPI000948C06B|nr:hydrogenase formation protein HypD [Teredinibacter haidensis]